MRALNTKCQHNKQLENVHSLSSYFTMSFYLCFHNEDKRRNKDYYYFFLTALLGTKYITLITYKYKKHAVPKRENSERAIIAHARLPADLTSVDIYKFT
jgi:hypothetical protein